MPSNSHTALESICDDGLQRQALLTPIYLKLSADMPWPETEVFYLLTNDGLFLCRNHPFFRSCVATNQFPGELAAHTSFLRLRYPKVPQRLFEKVVGYFAQVAIRHCAEAAVLLVWNRRAQRMEAIVPEQTSYVMVKWEGDAYPIKVHYAVPRLPTHFQLIGDIHSHPVDSAYRSRKDDLDHTHFPGLHIIVGRLHNEPPDLHLVVMVDGLSFEIRDPELVIEGYRRRRIHEVPRRWMEKIAIRRLMRHEIPEQSYGRERDNCGSNFQPYESEFDSKKGKDETWNSSTDVS